MQFKLVQPRSIISILPDE